MSKDARLEAGWTSDPIYILSDDRTVKPEECQHTRGHDWYGLRPKDVGRPVFLHQGGPFRGGLLASRIYFTIGANEPSTTLFHAIRARMMQSFQAG